MSTCYACNLSSSTVEHVPPKSFFPKDERKDLITVPSCEAHNNDNSRDVEYVRNIITMHFDNNPKGFNHFRNKTFRSFQHSPGLFKSTLKNSRRIKLNGIDTLSFGINLDRFDNVMNYIGKALYFRDFNARYDEEFSVFNYSLFLQDTIVSGKKYPEVEEVKKMLEVTPFIKRNVGNPDIFCYYFWGDASGGFIYKLEFYNGFIVYLFPLGQLGHI